MAENFKTSYTFRDNKFVSEKNFTLDNNGIAVSEGSLKYNITYKDIAGVHLKFDPTRFERNRFICILKSVLGYELIKVKSQSYVSIGNFKDQCDDYKNFIIELHKKLKENNAAVLYYGGLSRALYNFYFILSVIVYLVVIGLIILFLNIFPIIAVVKIILLIFYTPLLLKYFKHNKPLVYLPDNIPKNFLP